jgi:hypothetical protein
MASARDNMKALLEQRAKLQNELEALKGKIAGLDMAINIVQKAGTKTDLQPVSRRSGVKGFVLDLLRERGADGLNAAVAVEIAAGRGVLMDRGSVSSLLSRLKSDDVVVYENDIYKLKEFSTETSADHPTAVSESA